MDLETETHAPVNRDGGAAALPWRAVFFDLDGTLVETAPEILDAVNDTLGYFGWPLVSPAQVNAWIGHGTRTLLIEALAWASGHSVAQVHAGEDLKDALPVFDRYYQERCGTRSTLYPRVRETLQALRARDCRLAVVTNKEACYTEAVLKAHGLWDLLDFVVSGDSFERKKPDPVGVLHGLQRWQIPAEQALFVGDSSIDAATARRAGVAVWRCGCCPMATTGGSRWRTASPTVSLPTWVLC